MMWLTLAALALVQEPGADPMEQMMAERVRTAQEGLAKLDWLVGRWTGTATASDGSEDASRLSVSKLQEGTVLHLASRMYRGEDLTHQDTLLLTFSPDESAYVGHYYLPAFFAKWSVQVSEDGGTVTWESEPGALGRWRGQFRRVSPNEFTDTVEAEVGGEWATVISVQLRRVPESRCPACGQAAAPQCPGCGQAIGGGGH